jgi:hypothetical protein
MIQGMWTAVAIILLSVLSPILLLGLCTVIVRRLSSGHYWVAVWIPMGWLVSLAIVELLVSRLAGHLQSRFTYGQEYEALWFFTFGMLLVGFAPRLRPRSGKDGLRLFMFSLCWIGFISFVNLFWIGLMFFLNTFSPL